jgi:hypothetical protein
MVRLNMVHIIPRVIPLEGVCEACVLGKHHREKFEKKKSCKEKTYA